LIVCTNWDKGKPGDAFDFSEVNSCLELRQRSRVVRPVSDAPQEDIKELLEEQIADTL
jgi:hypothetical protein